MSENKTVLFYHKMQRQLLKPLMLACKIGLGSAFAVFIADFLGLPSAVAAGTITLLTLLNTKWDTVRLIIQRFISFFIAVGLCYVFFTYVENHYIAFGLYLFFIVFITEMLKWGSTLSVNALIGMHFMLQQTINLDFILTEFGLLVIGVLVAFVLNLFNNYSFTRKHLYRCMAHTDKQMQNLLIDVSRYLRQEPHIHPWRQISSLKHGIQAFRKEAQEYQDDTFSSAPQCFIDFFDMRLNQLSLIEMLHYEIRFSRKMPDQAEIIADYIEYLAGFVVDHNDPQAQLDRLNELKEDMKANYHFSSRTEFEDRALLYHIVIVLEEFLKLKSEFLKNMTGEEEELFYSESAHKALANPRTEE